MAVVKNKRKESRFEANHHFIALRKSVTELILHDFGFSESKYEKWNEWKLRAISEEKKANDIKTEWQIKDEQFKTFFIDEEARAILELLRKISIEFNVANSIFPSDKPSKLMEYLVRRWHINNAIGYCHALKEEIQYVIRTLPVDINRYVPFAEEIDKQINLFKGVRESDNRFLRPGKYDEHKTFTGVLIKTIGGITNIVHRIIRYDYGLRQDYAEGEELAFKCEDRMIEREITKQMGEL